MDLTNELNYFYYHMSLFELQVMNGSDYYSGLSYNSVLYLNVIDQMRECTVSRIAQALGITKSAATLKVNELVKCGTVIKTQSSKDKRVFYLNLSPRTEKTFSIYNKVFEKIELDLKKMYTETELELFREILHTISGYEWRKIQNE